MNVVIPVKIRRAPAWTLCCAIVFGVFSIMAPLPSQAQVPAEGSISGSVRNAQTNAFLEGVEVSLEGTAFITTTQRGGSFNFNRVPAGRYTLKAFYTGLDTKNTPVVVVAGQALDVAVGLTSDIYKLEAFIGASPLTIFLL
jgi:hypothetical protein